MREEIYYVEAADGTVMRVPESKLEEFQKINEEKKQKIFLDLLDEKMKFNETKQQAMALIQQAKDKTTMLDDLLEILKQSKDDAEFMTAVNKFSARSI
ncbi:MAG: hypothetical protein J5844_00085 [Clostridia bacterium]|nr:hypothetical protein [Clostridia bacterium]